MKRRKFQLYRRHPVALFGYEIDMQVARIRCSSRARTPSLLLTVRQVRWLVVAADHALAWPTMPGFRRFSTSARLLITLSRGRGRLDIYTRFCYPGHCPRRHKTIETTDIAAVQMVASGADVAAACRAWLALELCRKMAMSYPCEAGQQQSGIANKSTSARVRRSCIPTICRPSLRWHEHLVWLCQLPLHPRRTTIEGRAAADG